MKLNFRISKAVDKKWLYIFLEEKDHAGHDFRAWVLKAHPTLKRDKKLISKYVEKFHKAHGKEIASEKEEIERSWRKHEDYFFNVVEELFSHKWPEGKYIAYVSISPINPRNINNKTFTIFNKSRGPNRIIVHELLHFMFYDYVDKYFKGKLTDKKKWHLSEIFNVVLMNDKKLKHLYLFPGEGYPNHRKYIPRFSKLYKESSSMKSFISKSIREINKIKELN